LVVALDPVSIGADTRIGEGSAGRAVQNVMRQTILYGVPRATAATLWLLLLASPTAAQKTDIVIMTNGDTLTCEIKELVRGRLRVSTDSMGTILVEWEDVRQVTSPSRFEVELATGERFIGSFRATPQPGRLSVAGDTGTTVHGHASVVRITPMGDSWWSRVDGSLDLGFSFTKANEARQLTLSGEGTHRAERFGTRVTFSSLLTSQEGIDNTSRQVIGIQIQRFLPRRWLLAVLSQFQQNEELQLDLRSTFGAGAGRYLIQTNRTILSLLGGVSFTRERFTGPEPGASNAEALSILQFQTFTFDDPETDISATLVVIPSLTEAGRIRIDLDTRIRREILKDFYWNIGFFDNYDSEPPAAIAERNDYGLISSFGWTF